VYTFKGNLRLKITTSFKLEALGQCIPLPRRVFTSAAIWRISMSSTFTSVNHFPYLPIATNPENNPCIQTVIRIATEI